MKNWPSRGSKVVGIQHTFIPFTEWSEVHRLELLISRNQRWITKPRKPKKPKATPMPATPAETALYTDEKLATRWHCSTSRLQYWRSNGQGLPYLKIHGRVLYRIEDIKAYEQQSLIAPQTQEEVDATAPPDPASPKK